MKLGMLVRAEDRGLGIQSWEAWRHLSPDVTVVVDMGELSRGWCQHFDRYPGAVRAPFDGHRLDDVAFDALRDVDVILSFETLYDWRLTQLGPATVVQVNPEFYKHGVDPSLPHPTSWWAPTPWLLDRLPPERTRLVPVPVALDRWPDPVAASPSVGPLRVLHVAGKPAHLDRNGTTALQEALRQVRSDVVVTVRAQTPIAGPRRLPPNVELRVEHRNEPAYWRLYDDQHVLVMPRRYGGLCLPVQEAMAAALGVVMPETAPNPWWPVYLTPADRGPTVKMPCGQVQLGTPRRGTIAGAIDALADRRDLLALWQGKSRAWAMAHSWSALLGTYQAELMIAAVQRAR